MYSAHVIQTRHFHTFNSNDKVVMNATSTTFLNVIIPEECHRNFKYALPDLKICHSVEFIRKVGGDKFQ